MITDKNSHQYLRWLVKLSDTQPFKYDDIPKEFHDFFTAPGLSHALNIFINKPPSADWSKVENYIDKNTFKDFDDVAQGIRDNFKDSMDKLYAAFYFVTHHVKYDWERCNSSNRQALSIEYIFNKRLGVCADYSKFFRELAKRAGITSKCMRIMPFLNAAKAISWDAYNPPQKPNYDHEAVYLDIGGEKFISEPTWAAGNLNDDHSFSFKYKKSNFLIPYYSAILSHFPEQIIDEKSHYPFSWEQYSLLNQPCVGKELSLESNPFQVINVENGLHEMQFSFVQPVNSISSQIFLLENNTWFSQDTKYISFNCLAKDLPSHHYTLSSEKRCRYKMTICFPKVGSYHIKVFVNTEQLFHVYFNVKSTKERLLGIPGTGKEEKGFTPIVPLDGLTKVTKGYARIRFACKYKRSPLLVCLYKIKKGTFEHESENTVDNCDRCFTVNLPFKYNAKNKSKDLNESLVEDWVLIEFPENRRWEVQIYFANDEGTYTYGVTYFFDVTGAPNPIEYPIFDLPKNRTFLPFKTKAPEKVWVEPSTDPVILDDLDIYFHVFSEKEVKVYFTYDKDKSTVWPSLMNGKDTGKDNIKDFEYSVTFPKYTAYSLNIWDGDNFLGSQNYYLLESELSEESSEEKKLMKDLKNTLEGKIDYCKDIPSSVRKNVEKMVKETKDKNQSKENPKPDEDKPNENKPNESKPSQQNSKTQKPNNKSEQKPNNKNDQKPSNKNEQKPNNKNEQKPNNKNDQKPNNKNDQKPNNKNEQKPGSKNEQKPSNKNEKKPPNSKPNESKPKTDDSKQVKPNDTTSSKNSKNQSKPKDDNNKPKDDSNQKKPQSASKQTKKPELKDGDDAAKINYLMEVAVNFEKERDDLREQINAHQKEMDRREKELRDEFIKHIDALRKDWALKDQVEVEALREKARLRQQHLQEVEKKEKKRLSMKKAEVRQKIASIEKQLKKHPENRETLAVLYQQLIDIEDKEIEMIVLRKQKQEDEDQLDEMYYQQKKENDQIAHMNIIKNSEELLEKSITNELKAHQMEKERLEQEYSDLQRQDKEQSKCCLLI